MATINLYGNPANVKSQYGIAVYSYEDGSSVPHMNTLRPNMQSVVRELVNSQALNQDQKAALFKSPLFARQIIESLMHVTSHEHMLALANMIEELRRTHFMTTYDFQYAIGYDNATLITSAASNYTNTFSNLYIGSEIAWNPSILNDSRFMGLYLGQPRPEIVEIDPNNVGLSPRQIAERIVNAYEREKLLRLASLTNYLLKAQDRPQVQSTEPYKQAVNLIKRVTEEISHATNLHTSIVQIGLDYIAHGEGE